MTYPNEMQPQHDRYILIPLFIIIPAALIWGVVLPAQHRMAESRARIDTVNAQMEIIGHVTPLTEAERKVLENPKAPWRARMPLLDNDVSKLEHYSRVITGIQNHFSSNGARIEGIRSSWDPIQADFTTPRSMPLAQKEEMAAPSPDAVVAGWALEVQIALPPSSLGRALHALPRVDPLLVPAGLRWEAREGKSFQALILRNLYLAPSAPSPTP